MKLGTLLIGDIVGQAGLRRLFFSLPSLKKQYNPDLIVVNGENVNEGFGILPEQADKILQQGVDVITSGNHIWQHTEELAQYWQQETRLLRPENYPAPAPGKGFTVIKKRNEQIAVINLQARQLMPHLVNCPITTLNHILKKVKQQHVNHIFIDFHGELVAEKELMAYTFDGKITALVGTHTHTPTIDERILPQGTAYVSDLGMVGATPSIIGGNIENSLLRATSQIPNRSIVADGDKSILCGLFIESQAGKALSIKRIIEY